MISSGMAPLSIINNDLQRKCGSESFYIISWPVVALIKWSLKSNNLIILEYQIKILMNHEHYKINKLHVKIKDIVHKCNSNYSLYL